MQLRVRDAPTNCQNEPAYPDHDTVVFCLSAPDMTAHLRSAHCKTEHPHLITECREFQMTLDYIKRLHIGFNQAIAFTEVLPCGSFGGSIGIDQLYDDVTPEGQPNPWHVGAIGRQGWPNPEEVIQGELELCVFLFSLILETKPRLVFESGTNVGTTTRAMGAACWVNGFGQVVSCETDKDLAKIATGLCGHLPVTVRNMPALEAKELLEADLVFIDSSYESRIEEVKRVKPGAIFVMHDTLGDLWLREHLIEEQHKVHVDGPRGFTVGRKT